MNKLPGRPTAITPEVVSKLVSSFSNGMSVREACWQSKISHETYYNRLRNDEQFADMMSKYQASPTTKAKKVIVDAINNGNISASKWWLERRAPDEFGNSSHEINKSEDKTNQFANMSDNEMRLLGIEISKLIVYDNNLQINGD